MSSLQCEEENSIIVIDFDKTNIRPMVSIIYTFLRKHSQAWTLRKAGIGLLLSLMIAGISQLWAISPAMAQDSQSIGSLNVRLSSKVIHPPKDLITQTLHLPNLQIARPMVGSPTKSAILEDDQRHRMVILSSDNNKDVIAYVLDNIDLEPYLPELRQQAMVRGCDRDRMEITGGLGCVALSLKDIMETHILP